MITNPQQLEAFNRKLQSEEKLTYMEALAIVESLHKEAVLLGVVNSDNMLDGIEVDIRIADAINRVGSITK